MSGFTVRRAGDRDAALVREVRLRALADSPYAFDSTIEVERAWSEAEWRAWIARGATFVLEREGAVHGLVAGVPHESEPAARFLAAMWVSPALRGSGAADVLIGAVLDWAKAEGAGEVWLDVDRDDPRARRAYERNGFRPSGQRIRPRDGRAEVEMRCALAGPA